MLKFNPDQNKALKKAMPTFNKVNRTIISSQLDKAFMDFDGKFEFMYEPKGHDFGWHPSGDCTPPVTELYEKAKNSLDPDHVHVNSLRHLNKTFMVGHYWHQIIQFLLVEAGLAEAQSIERVAYYNWGEPDASGYHRVQSDKHDQELSEEFMPFTFVRGQGDIAPLKTKDWTGLVDIKTMGSNDFNQKRIPDRFANKYHCQLNVYMDLFDLDQAMILAVNKDSGHGFQEFTFVKNQELVDAIYRKWRRVSYCLWHDIIPSESDNKEYALPIGDENE